MRSGRYLKYLVHLFLLKHYIEYLHDQMRSDSLPPPPTKHLDAVSVCSCCSPTSSTADAAFIPIAKSWHLGPGSLVLLTESADQIAPQSYSMDFFREIVFERTMRVRIRDGIFYSSDTHIPVHLSFVLLSDASCLTSECSLLGADDDIHPAVVTIPLAAEGALRSSDASSSNECDRDYVILSDDEDDEKSADGHFTAQTVPQIPPNLSSSSSSSSSSLPRSLTAVEESEWIAMRVWCSLCVSIAQQHMGTLTMDDRLQAAAEQDFVSTRQLHKQVRVTTTVDLCNILKLRLTTRMKTFVVVSILRDVCIIRIIIIIFIIIFL